MQKNQRLCSSFIFEPSRYPMTQHYNTYQLNALQQLADFRRIFYDENKNVRTDSLQKSVNSFVDLFCQHHFADSDYSAIQKKPEEFATTDEWINQFDIGTILKGITYYIWTNKSNKGYLIIKIKDGSMHKYLSRLNDILANEHMQSKLQQRNNALSNLFKKQNNPR